MLKPDTQLIHAHFSLEFSETESNPFRLDVRFTMPAKGVIAIFGPSGSGKTTLLRCMAGLQKSINGYFQMAGDVWQDEKTFVPVNKRQQGFVFQEASLFDHLTVAGNLEYAQKRASKSTKAAMASGQNLTIDYQQIISLLGIEKLLTQYPSTLSGGERQRVAIARALLRQPKILFMDEPLAALDYQRKQEILPYLETLSQSLAIPVVYVSHAIEEVARLADYLLVMDAGKIVTQGKLQEVLSRVDLPVHLDNDLGAVFDATVLARDDQWHLMQVQFAGGTLWLRDTGHALKHRLRVRVLAKDVSLANTRQDSSILNNLQASVRSIVEDSEPAMALVSLAIGETLLIARLTKRSVAHLELRPEKGIWAQIKSVAILP